MTKKINIKLNCKVKLKMILFFMVFFSGLYYLNYYSTKIVLADVLYTCINPDPAWLFCDDFERDVDFRNGTVSSGG